MTILKTRSQSNHYAVAVCPPPHIVAKVKEFKLALKQHIGWYSSVNSMAHITVASFTANSWQLENACWFTKDFCARRAALPLLFNHFGTYSNGALFLAPEDRSRQILTPLVKDFCNKFPLQALHSTDPHMSIGRRLETLELIYARMLFAKTVPQLSFKIEGLSLRRLDEERGQYDIIAHFPFSDNSTAMASQAWQGLLF